MSIIDPPTRKEPDRKDPLGFGLKSIAEPLQRWWLIGKGNPYFYAEIREARPRLGIPEAGFGNTAEFVDWVALRRPRHGHMTAPISLTVDGQLLEGPESLTRFHYRNISWPIEHHELPGRCCPTDPLFLSAMDLAKRFGIDRAGSEPGFPGPTEAVVGYVIVGRWPHPKSSTGMSWTEESNYVDPITHERFEEWSEVVLKGLKTRGGEGRQLAIWYEWWALRRSGKSISEIAREFDSDIPGTKTVEQRTIREGIKAVERMMSPVEKPR